MKASAVEVGFVTIENIEPGQMFMYEYSYYIKLKQLDTLTPVYGRQYVLNIDNGVLVTFDQATTVYPVVKITLHNEIKQPHMNMNSEFQALAKQFEDEPTVLPVPKDELSFDKDEAGPVIAPWADPVEKSHAKPQPKKGSLIQPMKKEAKKYRPDEEVTF